MFWGKLSRSTVTLIPALEYMTKTKKEANFVNSPLSLTVKSCIQEAEQSTTMLPPNNLNIQTAVLRWEQQAHQTDCCVCDSRFPRDTRLCHATSLDGTFTRSAKSDRLFPHWGRGFTFGQAAFNSWQLFRVLSLLGAVINQTVNTLLSCWPNLMNNTLCRHFWRYFSI